MGVSVEYIRTCDVCHVETDRQAWGILIDPEIAMARPNFRENTYMVNGVYSTLCDECAKPLILAFKLVGANKKEQTNVG